MNLKFMRGSRVGNPDFRHSYIKMTIEHMGAGEITMGENTE